MENKMNSTTDMYTRPLVLSHQPIRFETAQSWNRGQGDPSHKGTGDDGINYPLDSYTGPRPQPWF